MVTAVPKSAHHIWESAWLNLKLILQGNSNLSAIAAVVVANVVLIAFVIVAFMENDEDLKKEAKAAKGKSS